MYLYMFVFHFDSSIIFLFFFVTGFCDPIQAVRKPVEASGSDPVAGGFLIQFQEFPSQSIHYPARRSRLARLVSL